jgi:hypothetical protein
MEIVNTTSTTDPVNMYSQFNNFILNPIVFIIILIVIIVYYLFSYSLTASNGIGQQTTSANGLNIIIIVILALLIAVHAFQYFFSINVTAYLKDLFSPTAKLDIVVDETTFQPAPVPEIRFKKQVFNVPGNYYTYDNAKAICTAYGADLATYKQIEDAYENGAEWCNYGWSADQLALFPTQQKTYDKLQSTKGHENDCGRPGINGGYIANPNVKFGVNCYGYKPKITETEEELMKNVSPYPQTMEDVVFQKRVDFWKTKLSEILVSPFNYKTWGEF